MGGHMPCKPGWDIVDVSICWCRVEMLLGEGIPFISSHITLDVLCAY